MRCFGAIVAAIIVGVLAASLQLKGWAPLVLLPVLVGVTVGLSLLVIRGRALEVSPNRLIVGAILLSLVAIVAEHAWLYGDFRRQWHDARAQNAQVALFRPDAPWSPGEYFAHEFSPWRGALWCLDALVVAASATATALALQSSIRSSDR